MFSRLLQKSVRAGAQRFAKAAQLVRVSPNVLTLVGLLITMGAAVLIALDLLIPAGLVLLAAGSFDILDGAVARASGKTHRYGAFLDSTADRYGEGVVYLGLLYLFLVREHKDLEVFLIVGALLGSLLVSYVRARAQSLGFTCDVGWFARPERVVITALGLLVNQMTIVLWILVVATNFTALQRVHAVWTQYRAQLRGEAQGGPGSEDPAQSGAGSPQRRGAAPTTRGAV
ncbi:MAG: CDP-alcohol phosphatidyltransferase family protein [Candidatus Dormibacteraeota bacterium]|nr:CDP-alcohol phosphatidyltransferase family protein [Candidatus Dormibacteraeota bacterium]